ncbi:MAG: ATP-binding cassette domain-containing protein, partial [Spirochaetales bacterium]
MQNTCAIELKNIRKTFGSVVANDQIDLQIKRGEILCLLGENGSGKTTLMNMLSGIYQPDSGEIYKDGQQVSIRSPKDAYTLGIGMIHQHYHLVDVFTAAQNIILGLEHEKMDLGAVNDKVKGICDRYGFNVDPKKKIYDMSVSQKQTIEIVKVLYRGAEILILDEPTAVLTPQETDKLFAVLRNMKNDNKAIVLITHKLAEVLDVSDKVAILRKGRYI